MTQKDDQIRLCKMTELRRPRWCIHVVPGRERVDLLPRKVCGCVGLGGDLPEKVPGRNICYYQIQMLLAPLPAVKVKFLHFFLCG